MTQKAWEPVMNLQVYKKKTLWPLFIDRVQLPQGYSQFEEAVYFLPLSSQKFLVRILSTSEGWKAESTLEPPSQKNKPSLNQEKPRFPVF